MVVWLEVGGVQDKDPAFRREWSVVDRTELCLNMRAVTVSGRWAGQDEASSKYIWKS